MDGENFLEPIIRAANAWFAPRPGDYMENGVLMCGTCGKARQFRLGTRLVPCLCRCDENAQAKEEQTRQTERVMAAVRRNVLHDPNFDGGPRFEDDADQDGKHSIVCRRFVERWPEMRDGGQGLLLYGPPGSGKTYAAWTVTRELRERGVAAQMASISRLIFSMDDWGAREPILAAVQSVPCLVLDDLGAQRQSDFVCERLFAVVDARVQSGRPLIITTNLSPGELKAPESLALTRIYERVLEACSIRIKIAGPNRRAENAKRKAENARRLLLAE